MNDWLSYRTQISPNQPALIWQDQTWTYAALNEAVSTMVAQLVIARVKKGTHVAVLMPNRPEYVFAIHALARLGAILIPLNTRLTEDELRWQADHADCTVVICSQETERQALPLFPRQTIPGTVPSAADDTTAPSTKGYFYERRVLLSVDKPTKPAVKALQISASQASDLPQHPFRLNALQSIVFTSGTTGYPKGAMLTYANQFWSATASSYRLGILPNDRWLLCIPLYHVGGMSIVFRCCLYGTAVMLIEKFDPDKVNAALDTGHVTLASFVPTMLRRLIETRSNRETSSDRRLPASVRTILLGGATAPLDLLERVHAAGWPVVLTYGMTEACSQVATATPDETHRKPGSVGKPLMFIEVQIVNDGSRIANQTYPIGEIIVRGPTVMQSYYRDQEAAYEALHDGWLHTGDLGYLDEEGDLWIVDRRTDLIVTGGENVYPSEVERVLLSHPGVQEACVVGVPDPEWGQRIVAALVGVDPDLTAETLIGYCRKHLAGYKIPREVQFVQVLPQTASGKFKRDEVRSLLQAKSREG